MTESRLGTGAEHAPLPLTMFHDAVQHSCADPHDPGALEAQRELFWSIVENGVDSQPDPAAQQAVFAYGELVDYLWFQPADAPLPPSFVRANAAYKGQPDYGELALGLDYLGPDIFEEVTDILRPHGLGLLLLTRASNFNANNTALAQAIEAFAGTTTAGQWLREFSAANGQLPSRLSSRERLNREAIIFGVGAQTVRQQFGTVSSALMHVTPGVRANINRQSYPLDEEPGSRRHRQGGSNVPRLLAELATGRLVAAEPHLAGATQLEYDVSSQALRFTDNDGALVSGDFEVGDLSLLLHETFGYEPTLGLDDLSVDVFTHALEAAYTSTATGQSRPTDIYAASVSAVANQYTSLLQSGLLLKRANHVESVASIIKKPPAGTPFDTGVGRERNATQIHFNRSEMRIVEELPEGPEGDKGRELQRGLEQSRIRAHSLTDQVEFACQGLLQTAQRFLLLPEGTPRDVLFAALQTLGQNDPVVSCLMALYQVQAELATGSDILSRDTLGELHRQFDYVNGLEALESSAGTPEDYVSPKEVALALRRALKPLTKFTTTASP